MSSNLSAKQLSQTIAGLLTIFVVHLELRHVGGKGFVAVVHALLEGHK